MTSIVHVIIKLIKITITNNKPVITSSSPLGVSHDDEPAEVDVDGSSSWVGVGWVGGGVEVGTRIKYSLPLP